MQWKLTRYTIKEQQALVLPTQWECMKRTNNYETESRLTSKETNQNKIDRMQSHEYKQTHQYNHK